MEDFGDSELMAAIDHLGSARICVWGDLILDRYTWGVAERVSPEAPVPILRFEREEHRLGGAAAVAGLAAGFGAQVTCVGLTGQDSNGSLLCKLLEERGVETSAVLADAGRPTTVKERFLSRRHGHLQLLRLDRESDQIASPAVQTTLKQSLLEALSRYDVLAVADYGKGACAAESIRALLEASRTLGRPVLVDPARGVDFARYAGATLLVPNRTEMEVATRQRITSLTKAMAIGAEWARRWGVEALAIKLDQDGMVIVPAEGNGIFLPTRPRVVYDITGAGDTVLAVLAMALAARLPLGIAGRLANVAGGLQVERVGVAPICRFELQADILSQVEVSRLHSDNSSKIVNHDQLVRRAAAIRASGGRIVFTNGCFAALHAGHVAYLREARSHGDFLIVAANSAASIRRLKGDRPIIPDCDRAKMLAALDCVDCVTLFDDDTPLRLLELIRPELLVKGGTTEIVVGREFVEGYGGRVLVLAAVADVSTTRLLQADSE